jgi:uncharacterized membrane protein
MTLVLLILALGSLSVAIGIIIQIIRQQKCLNDNDIRNYMLGRLHSNEKEYHRVIGHLGNCEKCQQRMHDYKPSDHIEDHLIDD